MARASKKPRPMKSKRSGIKSSLRVKQNNEVLKRITKELNDNLKKTLHN